MKHEQQMVRDWMARFGQETHNCNPVIPSLEIRKLRSKLIMEEMLETIAGLGIVFMVKTHPDSNNFIDNYTFTGHEECERQDQFDASGLTGANLTEVADGIANSLVVLLGTAIACEIDIKPVFYEVMRSNDSKLWTKIEVEDEGQHLQEIQATVILQQSTPSFDAKAYLVKDKDGKVIKSPSYSPANIASMMQ